MPSISRRSFVLSAALALAAGAPGALQAATRGAAPGPDDLPDEVKKVLRERFGSRPIRDGHVSLDLPEVAPDAREVPVFVESDLPMNDAQFVKAIHVIADHNPDIYVAGFRLSPALGKASIDTRIKLRRSTHVRAIAETSTGELWWISKLVYVTLNGCV